MIFVYVLADHRLIIGQNALGFVRLREVWRIIECGGRAQLPEVDEAALFSARSGGIDALSSRSMRTD